MHPLADERRQAGRLLAIVHPAADGDDLVGLCGRRRHEDFFHPCLQLGVVKIGGDGDFQVLFHLEFPEPGVLGNDEQHAEQLQTGLESHVGRLDIQPLLGGKAVLRLFLCQQDRELVEFVQSQLESPGKGGVETQALLEQVVVVAPDDIGSRSGRIMLHVQVFIGIGQDDKGVVVPDHLPLFHGEIVPVDGEPAGEEVRVFQQLVHGTGNQRPLPVENCRHIFGDLGIVGELLGHLLGIVFLQLQECRNGIELAGLLLQLADKCEIRYDEPGRRLGHDVLAEEPVDQAVMELQVGGQVGTAQRRLAQHPCQVQVAVEAILPLGEQQGDVGVVGPGNLVAHEHAGVRVHQADPLVIADLALDGCGPVTDHAAGVGGEGTIGGIETGFGAGAETGDPLRLGETLLVLHQQRHGLHQRLDYEEVVLVLGIGEFE